MHFDVAIVGAGAAGLACAGRLVAAGLVVGVFEARDRVGGRILTACPAGPEYPIELGAQVVHGSRAACWEFIDRSIDRTSYGDSAPLLVRLAGGLYPAIALVRSAGCLLWSIDSRVAQGAGGEIPVSEVMRAIGARPIVDDEWLRQTWAADPAELSVQGIQDVLRGADSGDGQFVLAGGFMAVPHRMAAGLDVRLECPVRQIQWSPGRVSLRAGDETWSASRCVVTIPPPVVTSGRCAITPLPERKLKAGQHLRLGDTVSVAITLSHQADEPALVFDADGDAGFWKTTLGSPVVLGVAKQSAAARLRERLETPGALRELLGQLFAWSTAADVDHISVADWGRDPWATGSFTFPQIGQVQACAVWAAPLEDTVFFAGEATCGARHPASVHGAIESGHRAADEVLAVAGT